MPGLSQENLACSSKPVFSVCPVSHSELWLHRIHRHPKQTLLLPSHLHALTEHTQVLLFQKPFLFLQFSLVQSLSHVRLFVIPWTAARKASLSITNSRSLLKLTSIELVMPFNHLIPCHPLLLLTSIFPSIRVFSNESALRIRCPKYWSFSFSIIPSLVAQMVKHLPTMRETQAQSLGWKDLLEKEMTTHSSILAWKIPWMGEPGGLQSMGSQRVGHD